MSSVTALLQCHPPTDPHQLPPDPSEFRAWFTPLRFWIHQDKILVSPLESTHDRSQVPATWANVLVSPLKGFRMSQHFYSQRHRGGHKSVWQLFLRKNNTVTNNNTRINGLHAHNCSIQVSKVYLFCFSERTFCSFFLGVFFVRSCSVVLPELCLTSTGRECLATVHGTPGSFLSLSFLFL